MCACARCECSTSIALFLGAFVALGGDWVCLRQPNLNGPSSEPNADPLDACYTKKGDSTNPASVPMSLPLPPALVPATDLSSVDPPKNGSHDKM